MLAIMISPATTPVGLFIVKTVVEVFPEIDAEVAVPRCAIWENTFEKDIVQIITAKRILKER